MQRLTYEFFYNGDFMNNQNSENTLFICCMSIIAAIAIFSFGYGVAQYNFNRYLKLGLIPHTEGEMGIVWSLPKGVQQ